LQAIIKLFAFNDFSAPVTQNNDQNFHMFLCIYKINKKKLTFQIIFKMKG